MKRTLAVLIAWMLAFQVTHAQSVIVVKHRAGGGGVSVVGHGGIGGSSGSTRSLSITASAGDTFIVPVTWAAGGTVSSVSDGTNSYSLVGNHALDAGYIESLYCFQYSGSFSGTLTVTFSTSVAAQMGYLRATGISSCTPNVINTAVWGNQTTISQAVTTTVNGALVVLILNTNYESLTGANGWSTTWDSGGTVMLGFYKVAGAAGVQTATGTQPAANTWVGIIAGFK